MIKRIKWIKVTDEQYKAEVGPLGWYTVSKFYDGWHGVYHFNYTRQVICSSVNNSVDVEHKCQKHFEAIIEPFVEFTDTSFANHSTGCSMCGRIGCMGYCFK